MRKSTLFWPIFLVLLLSDCGTKRLAEEHLTPHVPLEVMGDVLRFTLAFNPGVAFGLTLGSAPRWVFVMLSLVALAMLAGIYVTSGGSGRIRTLGLALVCGGAVGNLIDRVRSPLGVVDFIDVGLAGHRWWTFNLADMGITIGALILAWTFLEEEPAGAPSLEGNSNDGLARRVE